MKRKACILAMLAAIAALALALVGCGGTSSSSDSSSSSSAISSAVTSSDSSADADSGVGSDNTLTVGFDQAFPPYGYVDDNGDFAGFDLDLAAEVASRNGWEIEYVPIDWDAKDAELASGSIDCIWNGFTIEGRKDGYEFTDPYMNNTQVVVVRADSGISTLEDLSGKNVMAQADSSAAALLADDGDQAELAATFAQLQTTPEYNTAFMELESGAVDAVAIDEPVALFQVSGKEDQFTILDETLSTEHYGVGCLKGNAELVLAIEATLLEMDADGTIETLCEKYADQGISYDNWCLGSTDLEDIDE